MNRKLLTGILVVVTIGLITILFNCKYHWWRNGIDPKSSYTLVYSMTFGDPGGGDSVKQTTVTPFNFDNVSKKFNVSGAAAANAGDTIPPATTTDPVDTPPPAGAATSSGTADGTVSGTTKGNVPPPCAMLGICEGAVATTGTVPNGVSVTMTADEEKPGVLLMSFNMKELQGKQPSKAEYFSEKHKTCQFGSTEKLTDPMFAPLHLLPNARISHKSLINIITEGEKITLEIHYEHD